VIEFTEAAMVFFGTLLMIGALILSLIPVLPGNVIVWGAAIGFGIANQWQRFTPAAGVIITILMIVGVTSDFWLPMLGVRTGGLTCFSAIGSLIGGLVGTFVIPIPILGTLVGAVAGALLIELVQFRNLRRAMDAGQTTAKIFVIGYALEVAISLMIFAVYAVSLLTTG
jgi:uncharacterized protein YqgC (DUF456 family)